MCKCDQEKICSLCVKKNLNVKKDAKICGNLSVGKNVSIEGDLAVKGCIDNLQLHFLLDRATPPKKKYTDNSYFTTLDHQMLMS